MLVSIGRVCFKYRSYLPVSIYLAMLFLPRSPFPLPMLLWAVGGILIAFGIGIRLWGIRHIGKRARTRKDKARFLIAGGPFAMVRNPLYIANTATGCGFCMAFELPWSLPPPYIFLIGTFYSFIVRYEENFLTLKFGRDYRLYAARVPRWIPKLSRPPVAESTFSWAEVLRWERSFIGIIAVGLVSAIMKGILT